MALNRLPLKLAALLFAFVLWLAVSAEEPTDEWVPVRIALTTDSTVSLRDPVPLVRAFVIGRGRELLKLYVAEPVVHQTIDADVPDSLTLELKPGDVSLPSWVDARVSQVEPQSITLHFTVTAEKRVPVHSELSLRADSGWRIVGDPSLQPDSVTVRGPRQAVKRVTSVPTVRQELIVRDSAGQVVPLDTVGLGVHVEPELIQILTPMVRVAPPVADSANTLGAQRSPPSRSDGPAATARTRRRIHRSLR
jgi:YbbR domain-containing protein